MVTPKLWGEPSRLRHVPRLNSLFLTVRTFHSPGTWLFGLCCPLSLRSFAFPCDISWIWGRVAALRWWAWLPAASSAGFSCLLLCALVCAQATAQAPPRPHFVHHSASLIFLRGGWEYRPSLGRCSAGALHRSRTVCCVPAACGAGGSAIRRKRTQLKLLCS